MDPIAERAVRGDRDAMAELVRQFHPDVFRFCCRFVGPEGAEDATQDTFINAYRKIRGFRGDASMKTWLFGIAINVIRNDKRKKKQEQLLDWMEPSAPDPSHSVIDSQILKEAISKLSSDHQDVVILHELEGLTYEECAHSLGVPVGTVKSRLFHAFRNLRTMLSPGEAV